MQIAEILKFGGGFHGVKSGGKEVLAANEILDNEHPELQSLKKYHADRFARWIAL